MEQAKASAEVEAEQLSVWILAARKDVVFYDALTEEAHGNEENFRGPYLYARAAEQTLRVIAGALRLRTSVIGEAEAEFKARLWLRQEIEEARAKGELNPLGEVAEAFLDDPAMSRTSELRRDERESAATPGS